MLNVLTHLRVLFRSLANSLYACVVSAKVSENLSLWFSGLPVGHPVSAYCNFKLDSGKPWNKAINNHGEEDSYRQANINLVTKHVT